jgi:hypothetical protein
VSADEGDNVIGIDFRQGDVQFLAGDGGAMFRF